MRLFFFLLLLFPVLELALLIKVGSTIGILATLLWLALDVVLGVLLIRLAGLATAWKAREGLSRGELPEGEVLNGLAMAAAGLLILIPGFLSDVAGLLILLPWTRWGMRYLLERYVAFQLRKQHRYAQETHERYRQEGRQQAHSVRETTVIEGQWERRDKD